MTVQIVQECAKVFAKEYAKVHSILKNKEYLQCVHIYRCALM